MPIGREARKCENTVTGEEHGRIWYNRGYTSWLIGRKISERAKNTPLSRGCETKSEVQREPQHDRQNLELKRASALNV